MMKHGLSKRDMSEAQERIESVVYWYVRGDDRREVLQTLHQIEVIFRSVVRDMRDEIKADFPRVKFPRVK